MTESVTWLEMLKQNFHGVLLQLNKFEIRNESLLGTSAAKPTLGPGCLDGFSHNLKKILAEAGLYPKCRKLPAVLSTCDFFSSSIVQ